MGNKGLSHLPELGIVLQYLDAYWSLAINPMFLSCLVLIFRLKDVTEP